MAVTMDPHLTPAETTIHYRALLMKYMYEVWVHESVTFVPKQKEVESKQLGFMEIINK
jgi:hypothetical protein